MEIDVAMPTRNSADLLGETLSALETAAERSRLTVGTLRIDDRSDGTATVARAEELAADMGWSFAAIREDHTLPKAREALVDTIDTDWCLFLDDDVRVSRDYLQRAWQWTSCQNVGAVQGRKKSRNERASDWMRRRARRAGTHATLIRAEAVRDLSIPADVTVLEDEWIRRHVEDAGWVWAMDHGNEFDHDCQHRHAIGWEEGAVAGKYGLGRLHQYVLSAIAATAQARRPAGQWARVAGYLAGSMSSDSSPQPGPAVKAGGVVNE